MVWLLGSWWPAVQLGPIRVFSQHDKPRCQDDWRSLTSLHNETTACVGTGSDRVKHSCCCPGDTGKNAWGLGSLRICFPEVTHAGRNRKQHASLPINRMPLSMRGFPCPSRFVVCPHLDTTKQCKLADRRADHIRRPRSSKRGLILYAAGDRTLGSYEDDPASEPKRGDR